MRHVAVFLGLLLGVVILYCVKASSECIPRANCKVTPSLISPGSYEVVFVATHGSKVGRNATGRLILRTSSPDDVSPRTREPVAESEPHRLYGFIELDFGEIGAPIRIDDTVAPAPNSADPVYPGVLVHEDMGELAAIVITIGTLSNLRDDLRTGVRWKDGPGIALFVHCLTPTEFYGTWGAWGIVVDGSGYFCARRRRTD